MGIGVLVGDADVLFADALATVLRGYPDLDVADELPTSGVQAIDCVQRLAPDVALLDYWLRDMDGPAVMRALRVHAPATKVVSLAWFHLSVDVGESVAAGAAALLGKDATVDEVVDTLRRAHAARASNEVPELAELRQRLAARRGDPSGVAGRLAELTPRQLEVLHLVANGLDVAEICNQLGLAEGTVRGHLHKVLAKSGASSQVEAVAIAHQYGLA